MRIDTPKDVPTHLLENPDMYITKIGKFLRKTSLDEIPQAFNILAGQMSIVGPRPALWNQDDLIEERDKYHANEIKPGLSGWAQCNGRDTLPIPEKAKLDGEYVKRFNIWFDIKIVFKTIGQAFRGKDEVEGKNNKYDYLIVGSGISGATLARLLTDSGKRVLVIEKRDVFGGNIFTTNKDGIEIHLYGPHIFHTSYDDVWNFVNKYCKMMPFINSPLANYHGEIYHLPFNMNTFKELWNIETAAEAERIIKQEIEKENISNPSNLEEQALSMVGRTIYTKFIKEYTEKQWGRSCRDLPSFIIKRIPLRYEFNNNYFNDKYQGIPQNGYASLINSLLDGIDKKTSTDFFEKRSFYSTIAKRIVFCGRIDQYYGYKYGKLEYRSLVFELERVLCNSFQNNAVVNYTSSDVSYTRITEHKFFNPNNVDQQITYISKEYPAQFKEGMIPYYPINDKKNNTLFSKYKKKADKEKNVYFLGRLARYSYLDMDDAIKEAFELFYNLEKKYE